MAHSRFRPSPARERWVLAAGMVAGVALAGAALTVLPDPDAAASAEVARASANVARLVQEEWRALTASRDGLIALRPDLPVLEPLQAQDQDSSGAPLTLEPAPESTVFDVLLAESTRQESIENSLPEALVAIDEALAAAEHDTQLAQGLLRKIQLAAKANEFAAGKSAWRRVFAKWSPQVELEGVSLVLQCALAAAPLLDEAERALAQSGLAQAYEQNVLPLPMDSMVAEFWVERLLALSMDPGGRAAIARGKARLELAKLEAKREPPSAMGVGVWELDFDADPPLAHWREATGDSVLRFVDLAATQANLTESAVIPNGFRIAFDAEELDVPLVRERTKLTGTPLRFRVGHEAPERLRRAQIQRVRYVRLALLGLALALTGASFFTARMLRRERRLAELKTRFISGVSHDLRTPLASILLMAENLEDGRIQDEAGQKRYFRLIRGETDRLRRLVDDVLDFSRIERGEGTKLKLEDTDLQSFSDELEKELRARVERGSAVLRVERSGLERGFALDREAVRRALWNLVDNALLHGDGEEIRLALRASEEALVLEVEDSSPGIPLAERDKIFEPFRQGNTPSADHAGGTGLGLAIVREIARAHGGEAVALEGAEGRGALFQITLSERSKDRKTGSPAPLVEAFRG